jgi:putative ABC transport system permease protein
MIAHDEGINEMSGAGYVAQILMFGTIVIGLFSAVFLFYTNSFLMKRRKKELGLYNILGMEKRHIAKILFCETLITMFVTMFLGLLSGILFSKIIFLLLFKLIYFSVPLGFYVSVNSLFITLAVFCGIFFFTLLFNLMQIHMSNPIELLKGSNTGEREPKSKKLLTFIGIVTTGTGYYIALTTESPLNALYLFFIAVILVIIGTYCLFTAGTVAMLKSLRKNKNYYYQTKHFTSISGMIYRMKQNAVGLANICILSTAVLVMVSTTVSLYISTDEQLENRCPNDISITFYNKKGEYQEKAIEKIKSLALEQKRNISSLANYSYLEFSAEKKGDTFSTDSGNYISNSNISDLYFVTADEYERLTGNSKNLNENEVLVYSTEKFEGNSFKLFDKQYNIKENLVEFPNKSDYTAIFVNIYYIVVRDDEVLNEIYNNQLHAFREDASKFQNYLAFDIDGKREE